MAAKGIHDWTTGDYVALTLIKQRLAVALQAAPERVRWRALYELTIETWPADQQGDLSPPARKAGTA